MRDDSDIVNEFYERSSQFINSPRIKRWRDQMAQAYQIRDGNQWEHDTKEKRKNRKRPIITINVCAPVVRMIAGHGIINRDKLVYYPRNDKGKDVDVVTDAVEYITDDCGFYGEQSQATEDKLTCGLGFTDTYFSYRNKAAPAGEVHVDRIFPGFCLFDHHATKTNLRDARWLGYFDIVAKEVIEEEKEDAGVPITFSTSQNIPMDALLAPFKNHEFIDGYGVIYHYYWIEDETTYSVTREQLEPYTQSEEIFLPIQEWIKRFDIDLNSDLIDLNKKEMKALRQAVAVAREFAGGTLPAIQPNKRTVDAYYYARICDGVLLEKRESLSDSGHTLKVKTGYYSEEHGYFYGLLKDMVDPQQAFNEAVSDYLSYLRSVPKGGAYLEEDAVADWEAFKNTRANEEDITVLKSGAIGNRKLLPKETPQAVPGLDNFINLMRQMVTAVVGLEPEFFSAVDSGNMTADLFGRKLRQAYKVLAPLFDGEYHYMREQGRLFLDCVRVLAENNNGMALRRISPQADDDAIFELTTDGVSGEYDVVVSRAPAGEDEMFEMVKSLIPLAGQLLNKPNPVDITPLIVEHWPYIKSSDRARIQQMMQPPPPPEPDPANQRLIAAQAADLEASAIKKQAEAAKIVGGDKEGGKYKEAQELADLEKTQSIAVKNYVDAGHTMREGAEF